MKSGDECAAVIEAQITRVVGLFGESDSFLAEDPLEQLEMDWLIVDDDAIEIENHRVKHASRLQKYPFVSTEYGIKRKP